MLTKQYVTPQAQRVEQYLKKHGTITPREALMDLNVYRLAARIKELRDAGRKISTYMNRNPETRVSYATYRLAH